MGKITLTTNLPDRLERASEFLRSLSTSLPTNDGGQQDISQSRMAARDVSARRQKSASKINATQTRLAPGKLEQELIKELVSYFE
jgi:hypothetical protein